MVVENSGSQLRSRVRPKRIQVKENEINEHWQNGVLKHPNSYQSRESWSEKPGTQKVRKLATEELYSHNLPACVQLVQGAWEESQVSKTTSEEGWVTGALSANEAPAGE